MEEIEKMFRKVEEETELRAAWERRQYKGPLYTEQPATSRTKHRRRSSVPNSQLTRLSDELADMIASRSPRPTSTISAQFPDQDRSSSDSFASLPEETTDTQNGLHPSDGRRPNLSRRTSTLSRTVGNLIPRRFGRPRSTSAADILTTGLAPKMVIDVSVQKATTSEPRHEPLPPATVQATLRPQKSKGSLNSPDTLMGKVSQKLWRKRKSVMPVFNS